MARIRGVQKALCENPRSSYLFDLDSALREELEIVFKKEESFWHIRSRTNWLINGDRNNRFFHKSVLKRRERNRIIQLKDEVGSNISGQQNIENHVAKYFSYLFTTSKTDISWIRDHENQDQTISFLFSINAFPTSEEIRTTMFSIGPFKAPGPDGFHAHFYRTQWLILKDDLCSFISNVFQQGITPPSINMTKIVLTPKVDNPESIKQFGPISLCNTLYKVITKIIVNRIMPFLSSIISPNQNAFIPNKGRKPNLSWLPK